MRIEPTPMDVCDYCYASHLEYADDHSNFDRHKKIGKSECIACESIMCEQCIDRSKMVTR